METKVETGLAKIRVVLIDDHTVMREGTHLILEQTDDIRVVGEAEDAEAGLALVRELNPDVVILDIKLRGMSGIEVARRIREQAPNTKILVLTAYDYDQYVKAMTSIGVQGYLLKDASAPDLVRAVRSIVGNGTMLDPGVATKIFELYGIPRKGRGAPQLTQRQTQVLNLLSSGARNHEMAEALGISARTVETHLGNIFHKLNASSRSEAIAIAARLGLVIIEENPR